jgi:hypothetical protein
MPVMAALVTVILPLGILTALPLSVTTPGRGGPEVTPVRWDLHPRYTLPGRAGNIPGSLGDGKPTVETEFVASDFQGLRATHRVALRHPALPDGQNVPFSLEVWLSDHVNTPVAANVRPSGGQTAWSLGYVDGKVTLRSQSEGPSTIVETARGTAHPYHKSHWLHILLSVREEGWDLFLNGQSAASGSEALESAYPLELVAFLENEALMLPGNLVKHIAYFDRALGNERAAERFDALARLLEKGTLPGNDLGLIAGPYLHYPTPATVNLTWEFNRPAQSRLRVAESVTGQGDPVGVILDKGFSASEAIHLEEISGLQADTRYFYRIDAAGDEGGTLTTGWLSFQTAVREGQPFVFAAIGDTESRPHINAGIGRRVWGERPHFLLLLGDLTDGGFRDDKHQWNLEYFHGISPLAGRVPVVAVPGNGDGDLYWFSRYHNFPDPGNMYRFRYGPAEFFMLDSNRSAAPGTEQGKWLEKALEDSSATWKILAFHHPTYTSDENDYGDAYRGQSGPGDSDIRPALPLMERHGVNLCLFGHLHTYERSWPVRSGQIDLAAGTVHVQSGGAGGNLEDFAPTRNWYSAKTYRGYHYMIFQVSERAITAQVYGLDGRLIDTFSIE